MVEIATMRSAATVMDNRRVASLGSIQGLA